MSELIHLAFVAFLGTLFGLAVSAGVDRLQRIGMPRGLGAALIVLSFFGLLFGFGAWLAPTIRSQVHDLRRELPDALARAEAWARQHQNGVTGLVLSGVLDGDSTAASDTTARPSTPATDSTTIASALRDHIGSRMDGVRKFLFPFITSTVAAFAGIFIVIFLSIYIAADPRLYHDGLMQLFPEHERQRAGEVLSAIAAVLRKWLLTQLIAMATIGLVTTLVLFALDVKAAFALGLLSGFFEFIPTVGPILSALPAIAMGFLDSPQKAVLVAAAYVGIQFLENHLLIPLLMKGGVNIPPALTILSQALMALLFGFLGLMVAVPLLAASLVAVRMLYVDPRDALADDRRAMSAVE